MHTGSVNALKGDISPSHQVGFDAIGCANPENFVTNVIQYLGNG